MEFFFSSNNIFLKIAVINFCALAISQFMVFPYLGYKIYNRCKAIGYEMKSRPAFAIFNTSRLWSEARQFNKNANDESIKKALRIYRLYWGYIILSFFFVITSSIFEG